MRYDTLRVAYTDLDRIVSMLDRERSTSITAERVGIETAKNTLELTAEDGKVVIKRGVDE